MRSAPKPPKAVVDTNLLISGTILKRGSPFALLEAWRNRRFVLLLGQAQRDEVIDVVHRPKIQQK